MAYGKSGRQGVHKEGMRQHGFWCTDAEWDGFRIVADGHGLSPANMIKSIGRGELLVIEPDTTAKALAKALAKAMANKEV